MLSRFVNEWLPLENYYFKNEDLKNQADIVIDLTIKNYYFLN